MRRTKCGLKLCQSAVTSFNGHVSKSTAIWGDESQGETLLFPTFISEVAGRKTLDPPLLPECTSRCIKYDPTSKTTKLTNLWKSIVDYLSACAHILSPETLLLLIFHDLWSADRHLVHSIPIWHSLQFVGTRFYLNHQWKPTDLTQSNVSDLNIYQVTITKSRLGGGLAKFRLEDVTFT